MNDPIQEMMVGGVRSTQIWSACFVISKPGCVSPTSLASLHHQAVYPTLSRDTGNLFIHQHRPQRKFSHFSRRRKEPNLHWCYHRPGLEVGRGFEYTLSVAQLLFMKHFLGASSELHTQAEVSLPPHNFSSTYSFCV